LAHLTERSEHPASPVLLTRNGPLRAKGILESNKKYKINLYITHFGPYLKFENRKRFLKP